MKGNLNKNLYENKAFRPGILDLNQNTKSFPLHNQPKIRPTHPREDRHHAWKGDKAGYRSKHIWVENKLGKPNNCSQCGKNGTRHQIHWANKGHKYKRIVSEWVSLCAKCHKQYDGGKLSLPKDMWGI